MSDFIIAAALQQAQATLAAVERWEINETDSRFIMNLLLSPPEKVPALAELMAGIRTKQMKKKRSSATG